MPTLPHPLTLEDRIVRGNRWRAFRAAPGQSLFLVAGYGALAALVLVMTLRIDPVRMAAALAWASAHATTIAGAALLLSGWIMRQRLADDARRMAGSAHAALPVWGDSQAQRETRLRAAFAAQWIVAVAVLTGVWWLRGHGEAQRAFAVLRWMALAAVLALVFVPTPARRGTPTDARPARLARVPRWLAASASSTLPHLPQWWWQRAASAWMRGRAATTLAVGLLFAPSEAAAIVLPVALLMVMSLLNALDVAHRLAGDIVRLLAERPPSARTLLRGLCPLHAVLMLALIVVVLALLHGLGLRWHVAIVLVPTLLLIGALDLLLALRLRYTPDRLRIARWQLAALAAALAAAFPPLLPVAALLMVWMLWRALSRERTHA